MAVHDRFGQAGGATRIDHPQRMIKRQPKRLEGLSLCIILACSPREICLTSYCFNSVCGQPQVALHNQMPHRGQGRTQLDQHRATVQFAPAVGDAVAGDQHLGFDLLEAVQHRVAAHVRRANAPHRTDAHRGQKSHHRLRTVGQVGGDAVARVHPLRLQVQRQRGDLAAQLGPAQLPGRCAAQRLFIVAEDGREAARIGRGHMAQHLLRIVDLGTHKPARVGHWRAVTHRAVRRRRLQVKVVPDALPVSVQIGHRPAPQSVVRIKRQAAVLAQPVLVEANLGHAGRR